MGSSSALWRHRELLAEVTGNPLAEVDALIELSEDRSCWMLGPVDGTWVIRLVPGPGRPGAHLTLFRLDPAAALPETVALREECVILSGQLRHEGGRLFRAGERLHREPGDRVLSAGGGTECICCVVIPGADEARAVGS